MGVLKNYVNEKNLASFSGQNNVGRYSKLTNKSVTRKLARIPSYVLHREVKKPRIYNPFILYEKRDLLQADLIDLAIRHKENKGNKYILIVCDAFTRKCWAKALTDKTSERVLTEFKKIYKKTGFFKRFMTDAGTEFLSRKFKSFLTEKDISFIRGNPHAPHVERLNRTLQNMIFRYMTENETKKWVGVLGSVVEVYNNRYHRTIKMSPNQAEQKENRTLLINNVTLYYEKALNKRKDPSFKVGDTVSIQKLRNVFAKGYDQVFTDELFKIGELHTKLPIPMYSLTDYNGEEKIEGRFYENELQRANYEVFKVEEVLERRSKKGKKEVLVKWKGWPEKYNQWIPERDITRTY